MGEIENAVELLGAVRSAIAELGVVVGEHDGISEVSLDGLTL